jgi:single-stranded DNA-specific DHH superfamily exonuclease
MAVDGERAVGSARSIRSINLHEQLEGVSDLFEHFGGHEFACGFSLPSDKVPELRARLVERFDRLDESLFRHDAEIDGVVTLADVDREFVAAHEMLQPFGAGNPQPIFAIRRTSVVGRREFGEGCFELTLEDSTGTGKAVVWPSVRQLAEPTTAPLDVLVQVEPDGWSQTGGRLSLVDARPAE